MQQSLMSSLRLVMDLAYSRSPTNTAGTKIESDEMMMTVTWSFFSIGMGSSKGPVGICWSAIVAAGVRREDTIVLCLVVACRAGFRP